MRVIDDTLFMMLLMDTMDPVVWRDVTVGAGDTDQELAAAHLVTPATQLPPPPQVDPRIIGAQTRGKLILRLSFNSINIQ